MAKPRSFMSRRRPRVALIIAVAVVSATAIWSAAPLAAQVDPSPQDPSLADLGESQFELTAASPSYAIEGLDLAESLSDPTVESFLTFDLHFAVELSGMPDGATDPVPAVITTSLNGRATSQLVVDLHDGEPVLRGHGWIDERLQRALDSDAPTQGTFENYVQYGSTSAPVDQLDFMLDVGSWGPYLSVRILNESSFGRFVAPSQLVQLEILTTNDELGGENVEVSYRVTSEHVDTVTMGVEPIQGLLGEEFTNLDDTGEVVEHLHLVNGEAYGSALVPIDPESEVIRGSLVAYSSRNSPSEEFLLQPTPPGYLINWPVVALLGSIVIVWSWLVTASRSPLVSRHARLA